MIKTQTLKWLKANAHEDLDGDFWIDEAAEDDYLVTDKKVSKSSKMIYLHEVDLVMDDKDTYTDLKWAIEKVVTQKEDPEYFL